MISYFIITQQSDHLSIVMDFLALATILELDEHLFEEFSSTDLCKMVILEDTRDKYDGLFKI